MLLAQTASAPCMGDDYPPNQGACGREKGALETMQDMQILSGIHLIPFYENTLKSPAILSSPFLIECKVGFEERPLFACFEKGCLLQTHFGTKS